MSYAWIDTSTVTACGGSPQLIIDGVKTPPILYAISDIPAAKAWKDCSQRAIRNFGKLGINVVCVDTNIHEDWKENGEYEPTALFRDIEAVLKANPRAKIITRLHLNPPYHWLHKHPNEQIRYLNGNTECKKTDSGSYGDRTIARKHLPFEIRVSIASQKWITDVCEILDKLCRSVKAHPLGDALIGIQVAYGHCGEWHAYANSDFSEPMRLLLCRIAKEKYRTLTELRKFYGNNATFESITLPTPEDVDNALKESNGTTLSPERHAEIIDYLHSYSVASAEALSAFCAQIKKSGGEGLLAGAFYGYYFHTGGASAAHFETDRILSDKNVDFLASPCAYTDNKKSGNTNMIRYVAESCRINGKLMLCEMDQGYRSVSNQSPNGLYVCENEEEYSAIVKRNIMENILLGNGAWYYDHRIIPSSIYEKEEYWNTPERLATIGELQRVCERLTVTERKKTTDVLVLVDAESRYHTASTFTNGYSFIDTLGKSGVGFDRMYLNDLPKADLSRYRCIVLADCSVISENILDYIKSNVFTQSLTVLIIGSFATVVGRKSHVEALTENVTDSCRIIRITEPINDPHTYKRIFREAGAHIYTEGTEVVIADNGMVMVHTKDVPQITLCLKHNSVTFNAPKYSTVIYDTETGERIL